MGEQSTSAKMRLANDIFQILASSFTLLPRNSSNAFYLQVQVAHNTQIVSGLLFQYVTSLLGPYRSLDADCGLKGLKRKLGIYFQLLRFSLFPSV